MAPRWMCSVWLPWLLFLAPLLFVSLRYILRAARAKLDKIKPQEGKALSIAATTSRGEETDFWLGGKDIFRDVIMAMTLGLALATFVNQKCTELQLDAAWEAETPIGFVYACDAGNEFFSVTGKVLMPLRSPVTGYSLQITPTIVDSQKNELDFQLERSQEGPTIALELGIPEPFSLTEELERQYPGFEEYMSKCKPTCQVERLEITVKYEFFDGLIKESMRRRVPCTGFSSPPR